MGQNPGRRMHQYGTLQCVSSVHAVTRYQQFPSFLLAGLTGKVAWPCIVAYLSLKMPASTGLQCYRCDCSWLHCLCGCYVIVKAFCFAEEKLMMWCEFGTVALCSASLVLCAGRKSCLGIAAGMEKYICMVYMGGRMKCLTFWRCGK